MHWVTIACVSELAVVKNCGTNCLHELVLYATVLTLSSHWKWWNTGQEAIKAWEWGYRLTVSSNSPIPCFSMRAMRSASWSNGGGVVSPSTIWWRVWIGEWIVSCTLPPHWVQGLGLLSNHMQNKQTGRQTIIELQALFKLKLEPHLKML